jgi:hypothetical protein
MVSFVMSSRCYTASMRVASVYHEVNKVSEDCGSQTGVCLQYITLATRGKPQLLRGVGGPSDLLS